MKLVDDYLRAIAHWLPKAQREDIIAELRDVVLSRLEAREAELGRPLTEAEIEAVLREIGHPLAVAARYGEGPQHVVGPTLYPFWLFAVKLTVLIQLVLAGIILVARTISTGDFTQALAQAFQSAFTGAVMMIGLATIAAWIIERRGVRIDYLDNWRVRDLRLLELAAWDPEIWRGRSAGLRGTERKGELSGSPAAQALGGIVGLAAFLLWWTGALHFGLSGRVSDLTAIGIDPGRLANLDLPALKATLFWPVIVLVLANTARYLLLVGGPRARPLRGLLDILIGAGDLALAAWFWLYSPLSSAVRVDTLDQIFARLREAFPHHAPWPLAPLLTLVLIGLAICGVGQMLRGLWEIATPARPREP